VLPLAAAGGSGVDKYIDNKNKLNNKSINKIINE
jgi:hypothetical protein